MVTATDVWAALAEIPDPEIPVISLVDLGVIKDVAVADRRVRIDFTPTFMGCPALEVMQKEMHDGVADRRGGRGARCSRRLVVDRSDRQRREKLRLAFAPPAPRTAGKLELVGFGAPVSLPYCASMDTKLENLFGPTPCARSILQRLSLALRAVQTI